MDVHMYACCMYGRMYLRMDEHHTGVRADDNDGLRGVPHGVQVQKLHCAPTRIHPSAKLDLMEWIVGSFPTPSCWP
jgi:hypothetical protein